MVVLIRLEPSYQGSGAGSYSTHIVAELETIKEHLGSLDTARLCIVEYIRMIDVSTGGEVP